MSADLQGKLEQAIRETLTDSEGAGSDLSAGDFHHPNLWIHEGNLDIQHLASHIIETLEAAQ